MDLVDKDEEEEEHIRQCARWIRDEEILLTECWIETFENGQIGANRTDDSFWGQIIDDFNNRTAQRYHTKHMLTGTSYPDYWTTTGAMSRYRFISGSNINRPELAFEVCPILPAILMVLSCRVWNMVDTSLNTAYCLLLDTSYWILFPSWSLSKHDYSLFVKNNKASFTAALVYVDDILITGNSEEEIINLKQALDKKFTIKDLGLVKYFFRNRVMLHTHWPDISYAVQHLSQFVHALKDPHMQAAMHLLRYLKGTMLKGLFYPVQPHLQITSFTDADWASYLMTRKSLTGYCIFLGYSLVSWKTKKQVTVSRSSTEAGYRAMAATTCELLWLRYLLQDLKIKVKLLVTLFCDNKVAQQIAANPCFHGITKHLEIVCHFTRVKVQDRFLQTSYIPLHLQLADIMTKALGMV
nr:uncharacterized mitochondrial protein AtMg00810-like [Tanacetum cinerariifolium]